MGPEWGWGRGVPCEERGVCQLRGQIKSRDQSPGPSPACLPSHSMPTPVLALRGLTNLGPGIQDRFPAPTKRDLSQKTGPCEWRRGTGKRLISSPPPPPLPQASEEVLEERTLSQTVDCI